MSAFTRAGATRVSAVIGRPNRPRNRRSNAAGELARDTIEMPALLCATYTGPSGDARRQ